MEDDEGETERRKGMIQKLTQYTCDCCNKTITQKNAQMPTGWVMIITTDDYWGFPIEHHYCAECERKHHYREAYIGGLFLESICRRLNDQSNGKHTAAIY